LITADWGCWSWRVDETQSYSGQHFSRSKRSAIGPICKAYSPNKASRRAFQVLQRALVRAIVPPVRSAGVFIDWSTQPVHRRSARSRRIGIFLQPFTSRHSASLAISGSSSESRRFRSRSVTLPSPMRSLDPVSRPTEPLCGRDLTDDFLDMSSASRGPEPRVLVNDDPMRCRFLKG